MKFTLILAAFSISFVACSGNSRCKGRKCVPTAWLDEVGCKPIMGKDPCCPETYDCSPYFSPKITDKCNFLGKFYNIGEKIPDHLTRPYCEVGCRCRKNKSEVGPKTEVSCRGIICPSTGKVDPCKYDIKDCCPRGICPEKKNNTSCLVNDKLYSEGEKFYVYKNNKPMRCMCMKGFSGRYEEPFCIEEKCLVQVDQNMPMAKYCAPAFSEESVCPDYFMCPGKGKTDKPIGKPDRFKCRYDNYLVNKGDIVERNETKEGQPINLTTCKCIVGPFLTCYNHNE